MTTPAKQLRRSMLSRAERQARRFHLRLMNGQRINPLKNTVKLQAYLRRREVLRIREVIAHQEVQ